jgi:periplasmic protein TonB
MIGMRLSSFLFISIALHAVALTYPVVFLDPGVEELIPVVVLSLGDGSEKKAQGEGHAEGKTDKRLRPRHPAPMQRHEQTPADEDPAPEPLPIAAAAPRGIEISVRQTEMAESFPAQPENGGGGEGLSSGNGDSGRGVDFGVGTGEGHASVNFVEARYAYSPKPEYPDGARREGKEGRVLLRVLVDEEGRSKRVEVNRSSGSEALDQTAARTIKRWRFSPARYGDRPVETWVRIPIDFRLTDARE